MRPSPTIADPNSWLTAERGHRKAWATAIDRYTCCQAGDGGFSISSAALPPTRSQSIRRTSHHPVQNAVPKTTRLTRYQDMKNHDSPEDSPEDGLERSANIIIRTAPDPSRTVIARVTPPKHPVSANQPAKAPKRSCRTGKGRYPHPVTMRSAPQAAAGQSSTWIQRNHSIQDNCVDIRTSGRRFLRVMVSSGSSMVPRAPRYRGPGSSHRAEALRRVRQASGLLRSPEPMP